jgi:3-dehydroquinate synthase
LVISDIDTLKTLTSGELVGGLAEVIKYGVIWDEDFFTYFERNIGGVNFLDGKVLETVVLRSAKIKAEVVTKDERDSGLRNILNYGHTIGHAVESVSDFKVQHGEAVAIGMLVEARISNKLGILDKNEVSRLKNLIVSAGRPVEIPGLDVKKVVWMMKHDKKILQGKIRFVLPKSIGTVIITDEVAPSLIEEALAE